MSLESMCVANYFRQLRSVVYLNTRGGFVIALTCGRQFTSGRSYDADVHIVIELGPCCAGSFICFTITAALNIRVATRTWVMVTAELLTYTGFQTLPCGNKEWASHQVWSYKLYNSGNMQHKSVAICIASHEWCISQTSVTMAEWNVLFPPGNFWVVHRSTMGKSNAYCSVNTMWYTLVCPIDPPLNHAKCRCISRDLQSIIKHLLINILLQRLINTLPNTS